MLAEKEGFEPRMNVIIKNETLLFQNIPASAKLA